jgi:hypothetical protein
MEYTPRDDNKKASRVTPVVGEFTSPVRNLKTES